MSRGGWRRQSTEQPRASRPGGPTKWYQAPPGPGSWSTGPRRQPQRPQRIALPRGTWIATASPGRPGREVDRGPRVEQGRQEQTLAGVIGDQRVGRCIGEEFIIVLPCCDLASTAAVAESALDAIQSNPVILEDGTSIDVTASIGVVATYGDFCHLEPMAEAADSAMYAAKDEGRCRVRTG